MLVTLNLTFYTCPSFCCEYKINRCPMSSSIRAPFCSTWIWNSSSSGTDLAFTVLPFLLQSISSLVAVAENLHSMHQKLPCMAYFSRYNGSDHFSVFFFWVLFLSNVFFIWALLSGSHLLFLFDKNFFFLKKKKNKFQSI
jgi:hypothetical protein